LLNYDYIISLTKTNYYKNNDKVKESMIEF
jgi:hypothetical protein